MLIFPNHPNWFLKFFKNKLLLVGFCPGRAIDSWQGFFNASFVKTLRESFHVQKQTAQSKCHPYKSNHPTSCKFRYPRKRVHLQIWTHLLLLFLPSWHKKQFRLKRHRLHKRVLQIKHWVNGCFWFSQKVQIANWVIICYQAHLLREPGFTPSHWGGGCTQTSADPSYRESETSLGHRQLRRVIRDDVLPTGSSRVSTP